MKKLFIISILTLFLAGSNFAQVKIGLRGGINFNKISLNQGDYEPIQLSYEPGMGFHIGLTSQLQISKFFIQPELILSTLTNDLTLEDIRMNGFSEIGKQRFNKLDVPIVMGLKFDNGFKIGIGPVASRVIYFTTNIQDEYQLEYSKSTVGYLFATGFDFRKFNIELRYEGNLSKYGSGVRIGNTIYDFDQRQNNIILSTAFYF